MGLFGKKLSEQECFLLVDKSESIPAECLKYAKIKAKLDSMSTSDPFIGMTPGAQRAVRNAQIKRRLSNRSGQGVQGNKSSWFA